MTSIYPFLGNLNSARSVQSLLVEHALSLLQLLSRKANVRDISFVLNLTFFLKQQVSFQLFDPRMQ